MRILFRFFTSKQLFIQKINELERKLAALEDQVKKVKAEEFIPPAKAEEEKESMPAVQIQQLTVEKIVIEHLDYANNFGQLGIKELTGKLNIGTVQEGDFSEEIEAKIQEKLGNQAKVNLRAKKAE